MTNSGIADSVTLPRNAITSPLQRYVVQAAGSLSAHDADGLRSHKGRKYAEVASPDDADGNQTVMVVFHATMNAYRATLSTERHPSGPPLYRIADSNTWTLKKPVEYLDPTKFTIAHLGDPQGYYGVFEIIAFNRNLPPNPTGLFALIDDKGWIKVDPLAARGDPSIPIKLAQRTDRDIWNNYRLQGAEVLVFRAEAEAIGRVPDWASRFDEPDTHKYLMDSLTWVFPEKSIAECEQLLRSYNLSVAQQNRLRQEMEPEGFPEWAEQHKRLTENVEDDRRFKHIAEELDPVELRTDRLYGEDALPPVRQRYEESFLRSYLEHAGYKRNKHDYLYRTDIPAMFRADMRTPFELARDKRMVKLRGNESGSTTKSAFSATFYADKASDYMNFDYYSNPRHYNTQANRYPGHVSDGELSSGNRHSTDNDSETSFEMDDSRDYPLLRRKQRMGFLYVIDTRGIEVVPRDENIYLNDMDFFGDPLEGRISMPTRGISAERIWLARSDRSQAARVEDILRQAGDNAESIEKATWAGIDGKSVFVYGITAYDKLIDQIAHSGGVVLKLPKGRETQSNDIIWPVAEHYRA